MYGFIVEDAEKLLKNLDSNERMEEITDYIASKYGVHDWRSSPNDKVNAIGFTTYEVEKENISKVMSERRESYKRGWYLL